MNRKTRNGARYRNRRRDHHHNNPLPATRNRCGSCIRCCTNQKWYRRRRLGNTPEIEPRRTDRKLHFGGLDAIPAVGLLGKGVKAFKGTSELADLAKLLKFKEGMPGFNPNLGKMWYNHCVIIKLLCLTV